MVVLVMLDLKQTVNVAPKIANDGEKGEELIRFRIKSFSRCRFSRFS